MYAESLCRAMRQRSTVVKPLAGASADHRTLLSTQARKLTVTRCSLLEAFLVFSGRCIVKQVSSLSFGRMIV